ncbi:MAG: conserved membrane protein of unknown function [Promethearchaeota archaeon]|nr:MAG: conserved membrane protein of unknown function [Candidatus Lokiarchaeota archaeon]
MFIFILLGIPSRLSFLFFIIPTLLVFILLRIYREFIKELRKITQSLFSLDLNYIEIICFIFLTIEIIFLFSFWFIEPVHYWDTLCFWDGKAKYIFFEGDFSFIDWEIPNLDYPLLVSLNLTYIYSILGQYHYFSKICFIFFFLFLILFLYSSLKSLGLSRTYTFLFITLISLVPKIFDLSRTAYGDMPLTFFYTISTILLYCFFKTKKSVYVLLSYILMGFMAWTKNEGLALLVINTFVFLLYNIILGAKKEIPLKSSLKNLGLFFPGYLIYLPWFVFARVHRFKDDYTSNLSELFDLNQVFNDLTEIFFYITHSSLTLFIVWIAFISIFLLNIRGIFNKESAFLILMIIFHFLVYLAIYIISPFNLTWHLRTSLSRELSHIIPIFGFLDGILIINIEENSDFLFKKDSK